MKQKMPWIFFLICIFCSSIKALQASLQSFVTSGKSRKEILSRFVQKIVNTNQQIDQAMREKEKLQNPAQISAALEKIDRLKRFRDSNIRTLKQLRALSFTAAKEGA